MSRTGQLLLGAVPGRRRAFHRLAGPLRSDPAPGPARLEKPTRYNPPSHPTSSSASRAGGRTRYGAPLSAAELAAQKKRRYPNMMPEEGTVLHWFLTNKQIHIWISMSVLSVLALVTTLQSIERWRKESGAARAAGLGPAVDLVLSPFRTWGPYLAAWRVDKIEESERIGARRRRAVDDTEHQRAYRLAHDGTQQQQQQQPAVAVAVAAPEPAATPDADAGKVAEEESAQSPPKVKRWFGIWE